MPLIGPILHRLLVGSVVHITWGRFRRLLLVQTDKNHWRTKHGIKKSLNHPVHQLIKVCADLRLYTLSARSLSTTPSQGLCTSGALDLRPARVCLFPFASVHGPSVVFTASRLYMKLFYLLRYSDLLRVGTIPFGNRVFLLVVGKEAIMQKGREHTLFARLLHLARAGLSIAHISVVDAIHLVLTEAKLPVRETSRGDATQLTTFSLKNLSLLQEPSWRVPAAVRGA